MQSFFLGASSLNYLALTLLLGPITFYLLRLKNKSSPTWLLTGFFSALWLFSLSSLITESLYHPSWVYFDDFAMLTAVIACIIIVQFAYRFPQPGFLQESRSALIATSGLLGLLWIVHVILSQVTLLEYGLAPTSEMQLFLLSGIACTLFWMEIVILRQMVRFSPSVAGNTATWSQHVAEIVLSILRPRTPLARAALAFFLATLGMVLAATLAVLGYIVETTGHSTASFLIYMSALLVLQLALSWMVLVYINHGAEPSTFMVKLVGIALVTLLLILSIVSLFAMSFYEQAYDDICQQNAKLVKYLIASDNLEDLPADVQYVVARPRNEGLIGVSYRLIVARDPAFKLEQLKAQALQARAEALAQLSEEVHLDHPMLNGQQTLTLARTLLEQQPPVLHQRVERRLGSAVSDQHYFAYTLASDATIYEVGFGWRDYLDFMHRRALLFALLMIGATMVIVVVFPYFFHISLIHPLYTLLGGVQQVNAGELDVQVEIQYEDEIGFLSRSFNAMVASIRRTDQLKNEFLSNTSHELRTPLNGIIGLAESMLDGAAGSLTPVQCTNLEMIVSGGQRLAHLINDILDFSRLRHHDLVLQIKAVDMHTLTQLVLTLVQPLLGNKTLHLINAIPLDIPPVAADENRIQQVMYNLVGNAIKFTEQGQVEVSAEIQAGYLAITVADTGIGIALEHQERIFASFEQGDGSIARRYGGTGLGLAITRQLVELHGGTISVRSTLGKGSCFTFTLPLIADLVQIPVSEHLPTCTPEVSAAMPQTMLASTNNLPDARATNGQPVPLLSPTEQVGESAAPDVSENKGTILVVDDEPINIQVLVNHLSLQEYRVVSTSSGAEALRLIETGYIPDLVILDVMMPRMSGYEVSQQIRQHYSPLELPILMLTARSQSTDLLTGFKSGANDYLTKPFDKVELLARVHTLIVIKRAELMRRQFLTLQHELQMAHTIQHNLLQPPHPGWNALDVYCFMQPAHEVGGDLYAYGRLEPEAPVAAMDRDVSRYVLTVGDVSGKGMPAALLMAVCLASWQSLVGQSSSPMQLLGLLDEVVQIYIRDARQCCALVSIELNRCYGATVSNEGGWLLRVANAGGIPPLIKRAQGGLEWVDVGGIPLGFGLSSRQGYREVSSHLNIGDMLVLMSDGVVEARNIRKSLLGFEQVADVVAAAPHTNAQALLNHLRTAVTSFIGGAQQHDDITIVVVQVELLP